MPYRLKVDLEGLVLRFPLAPGTHLIGAAADCAVRISHLTVSASRGSLGIDS